MPDVPVWPACDQECLYCSNPAGDYRRRTAEHSFPALVRRLVRYRAGEESFAKFNDARDNLTLTGGEPTLHPQFLRLLAAARKGFPYADLRLLTHGRRFALRDFARRTLDAAGSPCEVAVNLVGAERGIEEAAAGVENLLGLRGPGQRVVIRVVLTRPQVRGLPRLAGTLLRRLAGIDRLELVFMEMEGRAELNIGVLGLRMGECAAALDSMYGVLRRFREFRLYHFPLCVLPERLRAHAWSTLDPAKVVHAFVCKDCRLRPGCVGIHKSYARRMGVAEFRPPAPAELVAA
ncbi:MAG: radical SAM protein [Elusimicrobiota bacterium]